MRKEERMKTFMIFILKSIFTIYIIIGILLYVFQRDLLYFPAPKIEYDFKHMTLEHDNETLNTIVLNEGKENAIIYFGGNGESVVYNAEQFVKTFPNFTLYLVDYRGYGWSSGMPSEANLFNDALLVYDEIKSKHEQINVMGRSLGSGVASYLSSKRAVHKLALITPFDSIKNVAQKMYPIYPMGLMLKDQYDSIKYLESKRTNNILIVMAENDSLVPNEHSYALAKSLPQNEVEVRVIENSGHNSISNFQSYYDLLSTFMNKEQ